MTTIPEPADRSIVAWFNGDGVVSRVWTRVDEYARMNGEDRSDRWYEADDRTNGDSLDWDALCKEMRDLFGPVLLTRKGGA